MSEALVKSQSMRLGRIAIDKRVEGFKLNIVLETFIVKIESVLSNWFFLLLKKIVVLIVCV